MHIKKFLLLLIFLVFSIMQTTAFSDCTQMFLPADLIEGEWRSTGVSRSIDGLVQCEVKNSEQESGWIPLPILEDMQNFLDREDFIVGKIDISSQGVETMYLERSLQFTVEQVESWIVFQKGLEFRVFPIVQTKSDRLVYQPHPVEGWLLLRDEENLLAQNIAQTSEIILDKSP